MPPGFGLSGRWQYVVDLGRTAYNQVQNAVNGQEFNSRAWKEARTEPSINFEEDLELDDGADAYEEWTSVTRVPGGRVDEPFDYCHVLELSLFDKAADTAREAVGVTTEYVFFAMKLVALEAARDVGWVANTNTVADIVRAVKERFPLLSDIKRAYQEGGRAASQKARDCNHISGLSGRDQQTSLRDILQSENVEAPPNLRELPVTDDQNIHNDIAARYTQRSNNARCHSDVEIVPVVVDSNEEEVMNNSYEEVLRSRDGKHGNADQL